ARWGSRPLAVARGSGVITYRRLRQPRSQNVKRLRIPLGRAVDKPEKLACGEAPVGEKVLAAVATTIAVNLTKKIVERTWNQTVEAWDERGSRPRLTACDPQRAGWSKARPSAICST